MLNLLKVDFIQRVRLAGLSRVLAAATALILAQTASATDPGNAVRDGLFLFGNPTAPFKTYSTGQSFGDWKVEAGNIDVSVREFTYPENASNSVDLNGTASGLISQIMKTVPGKTYTVRFMMSGNWDGGKASVRLHHTKADGESWIMLFVSNS